MDSGIVYLVRRTFVAGYSGIKKKKKEKIKKEVIDIAKIKTPTEIDTKVRLFIIKKKMNRKISVYRMPLIIPFSHPLIQNENRSIIVKYFVLKTILLSF